MPNNSTVTGFFRPFCIYRTSSCLQISLTSDSSGLLLQMANLKQGEQEGSRSFDWEHKIVIKLTENDFGNLLPIFNGAEEVTIVHKKGGHKESPAKTLFMGKTNNPKFLINVSLSDQLTGGTVKIGLTYADIYIMKVLLKGFILCKFCERTFPSSSQPKKGNLIQDDNSSRKSLEGPHFDGWDKIDSLTL